MSQLRHHLGFDICRALAVKAVLLTALYYLCFGPSHQVKVDPVLIGAHLLSYAPVDSAR